MLRVSDLRHKDIINIADGRRLGFIRDVDIDFQAGQINAVVVPGESGFFSFLTHGDDMVIPWRQIKRVGVDVILVELDQLAPPRNRFTRRREEDDIRLKEQMELLKGLPPGAFDLPPPSKDTD